MVELAQAGYTAYGDAVGWKNYRALKSAPGIEVGEPMPTWLELPEAIRVAWRAATDAIVTIVDIHYDAHPVTK